MYKKMADLQISTMAKYRKLLFIPSETGNNYILSLAFAGDSPSKIGMIL